MEALEKPIEPYEIEWKIQSYTKEKTKTIIVPYITARCVFDRFDEAFGYNWKSSFKEINGGFICTLSIKVNDEWISREDGADKTKIEPTKGGISDALKRAAHQFGLGRGLYAYPRIFIKGEHKFIPNDVKKRLDKMVEAINNLEFNEPVVTL